MCFRSLCRHAWPIARHAEGYGLRLALANFFRKDRLDRQCSDVLPVRELRSLTDDNSKDMYPALKGLVEMESCIKVKQIVITDDEGRSRITLGVDEQGQATFSMMDTSGRTRASISAGEPDENGEEVATFKLTAGGGGPTVVMEARSDGSVAVSLMRTDGHPLAVLEIEGGEDSRPTLSLNDPTQRIPRDEHGRLKWCPNSLVWLTVTEDPEAYLQFLDPTGSPIERYP